MTMNNYDNEQFILYFHVLNSVFEHNSSTLIYKMVVVMLEIVNASHL